jgi:ribosomal protein S18 acetylase RimI-like enzyme
MDDTLGDYAFYAREKISDIPEEIKGKIISRDKENFPFPWSPEQWLETWKNNNYAVSCLARGNDLLSFALWHLVAQGPAHLLKIVTHPDLRRQGFGKELMKRTQQDLLGEGFKRLFLEVQSGNAAAQKMYFQLGFKTFHTKPNFYSNGDSAFVMILDI